MFLFLKRAIKDISDNGFISAITFVTIGLIILILSTFLLFLDNVAVAIGDWKHGIRVMAYLQQGTSPSDFQEVEKRIRELNRVNEVRFISKSEALEFLKKQLNRQDSLLDNLNENPLPNAFEIRIVSVSRSGSPSLGEIEALATEIESIPGVQEVEYGHKWIGKFMAVFDLFRLVGFAMAGLFLLAAFLIIANTNRLVLYTRKDELEIMRLVGASERFIKAPFYLYGIMQGGLGAVAGLAVLYLGYRYLIGSDQQGLLFVNIRFLSIHACLGIIMGSMFLGWLGCFLSMKQFRKD